MRQPHYLNEILTRLRWVGMAMVAILVVSAAVSVAGSAAGADEPGSDGPVDPADAADPGKADAADPGKADAADPGKADATGARVDPAKKRVRVQRDQRFSDEPGKAGLCDVYLPATDPPLSGHPVVVVVHGGGWLTGDKWTLEGYSRSLARNGIAAVTINYRLAPAHKFPAQVDDVRHALIWTKKNAGRLSLNLQQLGLFGYSAGGHLSTLVASLGDEPIEVQATTSDWSRSDKRWNEIPAVHAVCAGGPPCDFRSIPIDNVVLSYFLGGTRRERPDTYSAASPATHVSSNDPVTQIIHGEIDLLVPIAGSREFHQAQVAAGVDSRLKVIANQGHMATFLNPETSDKVVEFFREVLINAEASR